MSTKQVTLITGGARSGKSRYALTLAGKYKSKAFIATAVAMDEEMTERIRKHQAERGSNFITMEAPLDLAAAITSLPDSIHVAVVDCLTVWLGNIMHKHGKIPSPCREIEALLAVLKNPPCELIFVTNEVGMGIVPENAMAREFRDTAGTLNRQMADIAQEVFLLVSGIAMKIKTAGKDVKAVGI